MDNKHKHYDLGHTHQQDSGTLYKGGSIGDQNGSPHFGKTKESNQNYYTNSANSNIDYSKSNMGIPTDSSSHGFETRPINTRVVWIMRVF